jgi:hypothetical protein
MPLSSPENSLFLARFHNLTYNYRYQPTKLSDTRADDSSTVLSGAETD